MRSRWPIASAFGFTPAAFCTGPYSSLPIGGHVLNTTIIMHDRVTPIDAGFH